MIKINIKEKHEPYCRFVSFYNEAIEREQKNIEAGCLSSCDKYNRVHGRFINIKYVNDDEFIFFSNYQSPKAKDFIQNQNVSLTFFWSSTNSQIRLEGKIRLLDGKRSDNHWRNRSNEKNALAVSSKQSYEANSYDEIKSSYEQVLENADLTIRPSFWGGFVINPTFFEFWKGHEFRLNRREVYILENKKWHKKIIQP